MGRRYRRLPRGRPHRRHVLCRDGGLAIRADACHYHDQENHLRRVREMMLRSSDEGVQAVAAPVRVTALDRARTFITLLVVLHHSVVNYTYFGNGDRMRWLGFDLVVLFNDSFFMAFMFLISGLFVHDSLIRNGAGGFLRRRAWRLGIPLLVSVFVLIPIAYYASFL